MSIRLKALAIVAFTVTVLIGILFLYIQLILLKSFELLEKNEVEQDILRVESAVVDEIEGLVSTGRDWAWWDDTYSFVEGKNAGFIEANLTGPTLQNLRLNFMLFFDARGRFVHGIAVDLEGGMEIDVPGDLKEALAPETAFTVHKDVDSMVSGVLDLGERIVLFASLPILNNERQGPVRGTFIAGRFIDEKKVAEWGRKTRLAVTFHDVDAPGLPADLMITEGSVSLGTNRLLVLPVDNNRIAGYYVLPDARGKPTLVFHVDSPRTIYRQGLVTIRRFFIWFLGAVLLFILATHFLMNRLILSRLSVLDHRIDHVRSSGSAAERIPVSGNDEIRNLAETINKMLESLELSERKLQEAVSVAENANRAKSRFLANMSHELRTPLNHIIGFTELVSGGNCGELNETQREYLGDVLASGRHLLSLINDILDISKVEAGKLELRWADVHLETLLDKSLVMFQERALTRRLTLVKDIKGPPLTVRADERMLRQIVYNLLANAVKFTPDGGRIALGVDIQGPCVEISVADTGVGISQEDLERLFEPFVQGRNYSQNNSEGTGLGLSLARKMVELHGGRIWAESDGSGKGTTFRFTIPLAASS